MPPPESRPGTGVQFAVDQFAGNQFAANPFAGGQLEVCQFEDGSRPGAVRRPGFRWMALQRHGRRPLAVLGRTLLRCDNRCAGLPWWSSVTLHETDAGRFAVSLRHAAANGGNEGGVNEGGGNENGGNENGGAGMAWDDAELHDSPTAVCAALARHDPLRALPVGAMARDRGGRWLPPDIAAAWRFQAAWSGLLRVLFGPHPDGMEPDDMGPMESGPAE